MNRFPGDLDQAVALVLAGSGKGLARDGAALTEAYRAGRTSAHVNPAAYLASRLPATFAACQRVLSEVTALWPGFAPATLLDVGAGPGTASWAAVAAWPGLKAVTQVEADPHFAALASRLNRASGLAALEQAQVLHQPLQADGPDCDVVAAAYVLAELPEAETAPEVLRLWHRAEQALILIEPGTPQGFARIRAAREALLQEGAVIAAPCTHGHSCPMAGGDWCHFKVRLPRSRLHMQVKQAVVPFEDEAFSYLVAVREAIPLAAARILAPPTVSKVAVTLKLCTGAGLATRSIPARDKKAYKQARKRAWGDSL